MTACMFHECETESSEDHKVSELGFRFCQDHRDKLDRIICSSVTPLRGMQIMDFWREARPNYEIKFPANGDSPFPKSRKVINIYAKRAPISAKIEGIPADPHAHLKMAKNAASKEPIKDGAFSLGGLITEEASKLANEE